MLTANLKLSKIVCFIFLLCTAGTSFSQKAEPSTGIKWIASLSWEQAKQKAKEEKKFIFVDCYATWCGPCKKMDQEVYINDGLGKKINDRFISVKIQMDQTKYDNEFVKSWYADALQLSNRYSIDAFPTFLFFTSNGELTYRNAGYKNADQFSSIIDDVIDPKQNYAAKVAAFKSHTLKLEDMEWLAITANQFKEDSLAKVIAKEYKSRFINKQKPSAELIKRHAKFIFPFQSLFNIQDPLVKYFYKNQAMADSAIGFNGFSRGFTDYMIQNHYYPYTYKKNVLPKNYAWQEISNEVKEKYDEKTAIRIELRSKATYYTAINDWPNAMKYEIAQVDNNIINNEKISPSGINNLVFDIIFTHATDKNYLQKGLEYMEKYVLPTDASPNHIDTYANVLYKIGRNEEAILEEQKAKDMALDKNQKWYDPEAAKNFQTIIDKMKAGLPTW